MVQLFPEEIPAVTAATELQLHLQTLTKAAASPLSKLVIKKEDGPENHVPTLPTDVGQFTLNPPDNTDTKLHNLDPREYRHNSTYGNYVISSRTVEANEIVGIEVPLSLSAYGPSHSIPYCLSCYRDISLSQRCSVCRWPICSLECEQAPSHAQNECPILAAVRARPRGRAEEYAAIEVIRCLLIRDHDSRKWEEMQKLEAHFEARANCQDAELMKNFVVRFIQEKCKLKDQFSDMEIDKVLGIVSVNTFSAYSYVGKHISLLFPPGVSFIQHDCNPNLTKLIRSDSQADKNNNGTGSPKEDGENDNENTNKAAQGQDKASPSIVMELKSSRSIVAGDILSINYVETERSVIERGAYLKDSFYFYCDCQRCRVELFNEINFDELECKINSS